MKRLLILSGKGGTGKTTTAAAFIRFSDTKAVADYDVDAPNLHLVTDTKGTPLIFDFEGGEKAVIDKDKCISCNKCLENCRFGAIEKNEGSYRIRDYKCEGCGVCSYVCPASAVTLIKDIAGKRMLYKDKKVFSCAELKMGRGNSGKLVTEVKTAMLKNAPGDTEIAVSDGSPGIGCPVIASVSGTDCVLIVTEPSLSGISDLERLIKTGENFRCRIAVCVNKWQQSPENTEKIIEFCKEKNLPFTGKIPYDKEVSRCNNLGISVADVPCPARNALYEIYKNTMEVLK